jgi:hypothetical protein
MKYILTRRVLLVEQELLVISELPVHTWLLIGVRDAPSLVFCVVLCRSLSFFFWPLYCLSLDLRHLITPLCYLRFMILVKPLVSYIYGFWLHLWYLTFTDSGYTFGILDLLILVTPLVS